jgi:hypothetical protein
MDALELMDGFPKRVKLKFAEDLFMHINKALIEEEKKRSRPGEYYIIIGRPTNMHYIKTHFKFNEKAKAFEDATKMWNNLCETNKRPPLFELHFCEEHVGADGDLVIPYDIRNCVHCWSGKGWL